MFVDYLILGDYRTNCYILRKDSKAKDCLIIDTGLQSEELITFLSKHKLNPIAVVFTHGHADHISGLTLLRQNFPQIIAYIHKDDAKAITDPNTNLSAVAGNGFIFMDKPADNLLSGGELLEIIDIKLLVFHTPGHTPGGICLYSKEDGILFSGDSLFAGSIGRTDFPGGSLTKLLTSIKTKLLTLPDKTNVYPGHGSDTTIGTEKQHNPYLQSEDID